MANQKVPKSSNKFFCKACDYTTERESQFNRHILTDKHKRLTMANEKVPKSSKHLCECGKEYVHASSLSKHRKVCTVSIKESFLEEKQENSSNDAMLNMFSKMMKENEELRNLMAEQNEKIVDVMENSKPSMTTNNNIINNNQKVNINMFLNNSCKDAINFADFIDRIEVSQNDLENNAHMGFIEGISKIFMDNLKQLSVFERPIHCTDLKREIMYIKDEDKWQKEDDDHKLNSAIQEVSRKSVNALKSWKETNPDYEDADSAFSNKCLAIQQQSIAGTNREQYYPKIIKNVAKELIVDKQNVNQDELDNGQVTNGFVK
jgi:hypothetical protein